MISYKCRLRGVTGFTGNKVPWMRKKMFQLRILAYILQMTFVFTVFENKLLDSNALIVLAC